MYRTEEAVQRLHPVRSNTGPCVLTCCTRSVRRQNEETSQQSWLNGAARTRRGRDGSRVPSEGLRTRVQLHQQKIHREEDSEDLRWLNAAPHHGVSTRALRDPPRAPAREKCQNKSRLSA
ncbi:hypothetical protein Q8A73_020923 [Channa argus]|nr:hypothetical protein Q8A73_020923 [Channa argus]